MTGPPCSAPGRSTGRRPMRHLLHRLRRLRHELDHRHLRGIRFVHRQHVPVSPRRSTRPAPPQPSAPHPTRRSVASRSRSRHRGRHRPRDWRAGRHGRLLRRHDAPRHRLAQWALARHSHLLGRPSGGRVTAPDQCHLRWNGCLRDEHSGKVAEIVTKSATTTTLSAPSSTSVSGEHVTYSAMVAPTAPHRHRVGNGRLL